MKTSSVLIRSWLPVFALVLFVPILTSPLAMAFGSGNGAPYSNGSFFPNEGTFQTTVRGKNLSGVATFSTTGSNSTSSSSASSGSFNISYQGLSYTGNVDTSMDSAAGSIAATMEASVSRGGSGTATETLSSTYGVIRTQATTITNPSSFVIDPITGTVTVIPGGQSVVSTPINGWTDTIATSNYQDTLYTSGSFTAKLSNSYPNQILKGKGSMEFTSINFDLLPPALVTTTVGISVKGSRTSDTAQTYNAQTVQAPSVLTTTSIQNRTN